MDQEQQHQVCVEVSSHLLLYVNPLYSKALILESVRFLHQTVLTGENLIISTISDAIWTPVLLRLRGTFPNSKKNFTPQSFKIVVYHYITLPCTAAKDGSRMEHHQSMVLDRLLRENNCCNVEAAVQNLKS